MFVVKTTYYIASVVASDLENESCTLLARLATWLGTSSTLRRLDGSCCCCRQVRPHMHPLVQDESIHSLRKHLLVFETGQAASWMMSLAVFSLSYTFPFRVTHLAQSATNAKEQAGRIWLASGCRSSRRFSCAWWNNVKAVESFSHMVAGDKYIITFFLYTSIVILAR